MNGKRASVLGDTTLSGPTHPGDSFSESQIRSGNLGRTNIEFDQRELETARKTLQHARNDVQRRERGQVLTSKAYSFCCERSTGVA